MPVLLCCYLASVASQVGNCLGSAETMHMVLLAQLCPVSAADAGLLNTLPQRHSFCEMQPAQMHRPQIRSRSRVCMLCACADDSTACALLEITEAPLRILRVPCFVDIDVPTAASPALDKSAFCLISWPAAIITQTAPSSPTALTCQLTAEFSSLA